MVRPTPLHSLSIYTFQTCSKCIEIDIIVLGHFSPKQIFLPNIGIGIGIGFRLHFKYDNTFVVNLNLNWFWLKFLKNNLKAPDVLRSALFQQCLKYNLSGESMTCYRTTFQ